MKIKIYFKLNNTFYLLSSFVFDYNIERSQINTIENTLEMEEDHHHHSIPDVSSSSFSSFKDNTTTVIITNDDRTKLPSKSFTNKRNFLKCCGCCYCCNDGLKQPTPKNILKKDELEEEEEEEVEEDDYTIIHDVTTNIQM